MNKKELINAVAEKTGFSRKDTTVVVNATFEAIEAALAAGDKAQIIGFGTFETKERPARTGKNPRTGEAVEIPASKVPSFKAGGSFKDNLNQ